MMISHFQHLEREEGEPFGPNLVLRGAVERISPIMMTALAMAFALAPMLVTGDIPGQEIEYPMALVIMGGLLSATLGEPVCRAFPLSALRQRSRVAKRRSRDFAAGSSLTV